MRADFGAPEIPLFGAGALLAGRGGDGGGIGGMAEQLGDAGLADAVVLVHGMGGVADGAEVRAIGIATKTR